MPKISVIIATRNRCALLPRAVESARAAGTDLEIVIVDDASEDQTAEVCGRWSELESVRYIRAKRRLGLGGARNVGLVSSTAPLITFLDDDDVRLPGSLDNQMKRLVGVPEAGMIYGKALYGDEQCAPAGSSYPQVCPEGDLFWELMIWNFIPCPTVLFRRACITRLGLLEQESPGIEDWDLWVRIAELYPVLAIDKPVAIWRQPGYSSEQFTARSEMLLRLAHRLHREKWLKLPRAIAAAPAQRRRTVRAFTKRASQQLLWEGVTSLKTKHLRKFTSVALASMRLHPIGISKAILSHAWSELQQ